MRPEYQAYVDRLKKQEGDDKAFIVAIMTLFYKNISNGFTLEKYEREREKFIEIAKPKILEHMKKSTAKTKKIVEDFYGVPAVSGEKQQELSESYTDNMLSIVLAQLDNAIKTADVFGVSDGFKNQWEGLVENGLKKP